MYVHKKYLFPSFLYSFLVYVLSTVSSHLICLCVTFHLDLNHIDSLAYLQIVEYPRHDIIHTLSYIAATS